MLTLLSHVDRKRIEPVLVVGALEGQYASLVPGDVRVVELGSPRVRSAMPQLVRLARRERPDVVFSTLGYLNVLVALSRPLMPRNTALVGRETNIPSVNLARSPYPRLLPFLYRRLYPTLDRVVCQSQDMLDDMVRNFGLPEERAAVIRNPVDVAGIRAKARGGSHGFPSGKVNVLAAGKFMHQKGFDMLLRAFAMTEDASMHLTILGEGSARSELEALTVELGVADRVSMPGYVDNPYAWMRAADLFVLSSRFEGFPNAVLEAQSCGTAVLAFSCPGGLNEIMQEGKNGWSVPSGDVQALAATLPHCARADLPPEVVRASVEGRYGASCIAGEYAEMFEAVARRPRG